MARASAAGSLPLTWRTAPKAEAWVTPGRWRSWAARPVKSGPATDQVGQAGLGDDFGGGAVGQQFAASDEGQAMAALGFVHVMGGDEEGQAAGGEKVDLLPEIAAGLGVHAGGGFVQQKEFRPVNQAGGQGQTLLPAAGKLAGQLLLALRQAQALDAFPHRLAPILDSIHAGHEVEVFPDAQVLVKAEALRHVADLALDVFAVGDDIVSEANARALVRAQQPAQHADEGRLAAAVRAEKAADFARARPRGQCDPRR